MKADWQRQIMVFKTKIMLNWSKKKKNEVLKMSYSSHIHKFDVGLLKLKYKTKLKKDDCKM